MLEQDVNSIKDVLEEQIRLKKNELENIMQYKTKGAITTIGLKPNGAINEGD